MTAVFPYSSRSLYDFALRAPTPPLERLVLIVIASHLDQIECDDPWPSEANLQGRVGVPSEMLWKALCSLVKSGLVDEIKTSCGRAVYAIPPVLPILFEHKWAAYSLGTGVNQEWLNQELDESSEEIRALLRCDGTPLDKLKRSKPGLGRFIEDWERIENKRTRSREQGEIGRTIAKRKEERRMH